MENENNNPIQTEQPVAPQETPVQESTTTNTAAAPAQKKGLSIASMILGIVAVVCGCIWYISIPCGILAIVFGIVGKKKGGRGMATAGLVLGIIAIALYVLLILCGVGTLVGAASLANGLSNLQ